MDFRVVGNMLTRNEKVYKIRYKLFKNSPRGELKQNSAKIYSLDFPT